MLYTKRYDRLTAVMVALYIGILAILTAYALLFFLQAPNAFDLLASGDNGDAFTCIYPNWAFLTVDWLIPIVILLAAFWILTLVPLFLQLANKNLPLTVKKWVSPIRFLLTCILAISLPIVTDCFLLIGSFGGGRILICVIGSWTTITLNCMLFALEYLNIFFEKIFQERIVEL